MLRQAGAQRRTEARTRRRETTAGDRDGCLHDRVGVELAERFDVGADTEVLEHRVGVGACGLGRVRFEQRAAHRARAVEQTLRRRHPEQAGDLAAATGFAEDRHVRRIPAELSDVVAHPLERGDDVEHADVAGIGELVTEMRHVEEPEHTEAMVHADDHHVVVAGEVGEVVERPRRRPDGHAAAVQPHEHRTRRAVTDPRRPHVQHETVFARLALVVPDAHEGLDLGRQLLACHLCDRDLRARWPVFHAVAHLGPRERRSRRAEAPFAARVVAVGNAFERDDAVACRAAYGACCRADCL